MTSMVTGSNREPQRVADAALGRAIRALRRERGLTLVQMAVATDLSQPFLSQLELGRARPSMRSLFRIAEALGTTQQALLGHVAPSDPVPWDESEHDGGARLLLRHPGGADVTEFALVPAAFSDFYRHDRHEFLYIVRGAIELELRDGGTSRISTHGPRSSVGYPGRTEHRFRQVGPEQAIVLVVHSGS